MGVTDKSSQVVDDERFSLDVDFGVMDGASAFDAQEADCHAQCGGVRSSVNHLHFTAAIHSEAVEGVVADVSEVVRASALTHIRKVKDTAVPNS